MPRPRATEPIPTGKKSLPWKFPVPDDVRHLHGDRAEKYFVKRGECLQFIATLRRQRSEHTAAFNNFPDAIKAQFHEAHEILRPYPAARSLVELARAEAAALDVAARSKPILPLIDELVAEKRADGRRDRYTTGLRGMLTVFANKFPDRLASSFTPQDIAQWLRENYANPNSRDSYRRNLGVLFSWAKGMGYVASNPVAETKAVNARRTEEVVILSPNQLASLFRHAHPRLHPYIAVCAFAAVRPTECHLLSWDNIVSDAIYIPHSITKTVARRVPMLPALATWLASFTARHPRFCPGYSYWRTLFREATLAAGWAAGEWPQDALRHSAISYWLAIEPNRAAVAKWSGNSEAVQMRHYENHRSPEEAAAWYAVLPETISQNIQ